MARTGPDLSMIHHIGGWGYLIGDEGSGYSIGRRAISAVAHAFDGGPKTQLTHIAESCLNIFDRSSLLSTISKPNWKFQQVAPFVLKAAEDGDQVATSLVREEIQLLANQSEWILQSIPDLQPRFTVVGGLTNNDYYIEALCQAMGKIWPIASFSAPCATPAEGAVQIAMQKSNGSAGYLSANLPLKDRQG